MTADPTAADGRRETARFAKVTFDRFAEMARDEALSEHERIGFPDAFRDGYDDAIWQDIRAKAPGLDRPGARILDIGPGCGPLPRRMIAAAEELGQELVLVDHPEMLEQLPASPVCTLAPGRFPEVLEGTALAAGGFDVIISYSVLQIVILDANPFAFADAAMALLRPGGQLLLGDIPNVSKLRRFLNSPAGVEHHKAYMRTDQPPHLAPFEAPADRIDDGMLFGLALRARSAGYDAYVLPQPNDLPLANRREDLLIVRP